MTGQAARLTTLTVEDVPAFSPQLMDFTSCGRAAKKSGLSHTEHVQLFASCLCAIIIVSIKNARLAEMGCKM